MTPPEYFYTPHWLVLYFNYVYPVFRVQSKTKPYKEEQFKRNFFDTVYNQGLIFDENKYKRMEQQILNTEHELGIRYMVLKEFYATFKNGKKKDIVKYIPKVLIYNANTDKYYYCNASGKSGIMTTTQNRFATWDTIAQDLKVKANRVLLKKYSGTRKKKEKGRPIFFIGRRNKLKRLR